jgi:DNA-binding NtrC family response regulator
VRVLEDEGASHGAAHEGSNAEMHEPKTSQSLPARLARYEATLIIEALNACNGNQAKTAQQLGVSPNTLHYKMKRLGLLKK